MAETRKKSDPKKSFAGVTVVRSDGLNDYQLARLCKALAEAYKEQRLRGRVTVSLGKAPG